MQDYSDQRGTDSESLRGRVMRHYQAGTDVRRKLEPDWYVAREFLKGRQYNAYVQGRGIVEPPMDLRKGGRKTRLINNKSRALVETIAAYLLKSDPVFSVVAATGEPEDQAAAMVGRQVLLHYWGKLSLAQALERTAMWVLVAGNCFWKVGWNPADGPRVPLMETVIDPATGVPTQVPGRVVPAGDVCVDVVSPLEFVPDPGAETLEDCQWAIHSTMRPVDEVKAQYPAFASEITPSEPDQRGFQSSSMLPGTRDWTKDNNRVQVYEYWHRACPEYPDGLRVVMTKAVVLEATPTPSGYDAIPFAHWSDRLVPGEFWSDGTMKDLVSLQKELNKRLSQAADVADKFKAKWVVAAGAVDETQITDQDGEVIEYQPGMGPAPAAVNPPPLPPTLVELMGLCSSAMDDVSGAVQVLQGKMEGDVRSGRQVAYQGQYGETRISLLAKHLARFLERAGTLVLKQVTANVEERRVGRIVGKNRRQETFYFTGADIGENTDVSVEVGSLLSVSKAERFNMLKEMLQLGAVTPDRFMEAVEMADFSTLIEGTAQDRNNALAENENWRRGQVAPVVQWSAPFYFEDHRIHVSVHNSFRKSQSYVMLPPELRAMVDEHCKAHEFFLAPPPEEMAPAEEATGTSEPPWSIATPQGRRSAAGWRPSEPPAPEGLKQSGQELAEGLPPVPPVADVGPENQH